MSPYKFQAERQVILDYLIAHPGCISMEVVRALNMHKNTLKTRLLRMEQLGEISRKPTIHHSRSSTSGKKVASLAYKLFAIVERAAFVDQARPMIERQAANAKPKKAKATGLVVQERVVWDGGSCRNVWQDRPPFKQQGGQGAVRRDVTVQSSAEMI
ncbi:MAG: hypothetical protein MUE59_03775 [Thiobacillaceae bacterium]|jgi:hypothetical protein|nr:hypothetical protein [Thiobacillaceae bacterium]